MTASPSRCSTFRTSLISCAIITGVLDAKVERVWPAGLRVTLVARQPVAAIANGTGFALLDADAIQVGHADKAPSDLPVVTVPVGNDRVLAAVLKVIRNLPADLLERVSGIGAQTEDTVSFDLRDGPTRRVGECGRLGAQGPSASGHARLALPRQPRG